MSSDAPAEELRLREADLDWRTVEREVLALDLTRSEYLAVNGTGSILWEALAEGASRDQLRVRLVGATGIDGATAHRDIEAFLSQLREHGLLEETGGRADG